MTFVERHLAGTRGRLWRLFRIVVVEAGLTRPEGSVHWGRDSGMMRPWSIGLPLRVSTPVNWPAPLTAWLAPDRPHVPTTPSRADEHRGGSGARCDRRVGRRPRVALRARGAAAQLPVCRMPGVAPARRCHLASGGGA